MKENSSNKVINPDQPNIQTRRVTSLLPAPYNTPSWQKVFGSSIDYLFQPNQSQKFNAFTGGIPPYYNTSDIYLNEINNDRQFYQLTPAGISLNSDLNIDYSIFYDDLINSIRFNGGLTNNHNRLFQTQSYSWAPPIDLDKLQNYKQYFWVKNGPISKWAGYPVVEYVGDGATTMFNFNTPVVAQSDIKVFVDNVELTLGVDYTINNRSVAFTLPPGENTVIRIVAFRTIGYISQTATQTTLTVNAPSITKTASDVVVFLNNQITTDYQVTQSQSGFAVEFAQPLIAGTFVEVLTYRQLNVTEDIIGQKNFLDVNGYQFSSGQKIRWAYDVAPSIYNQKESIVEGVGREIRLAFDGELDTSGWDLSLWDSAAWSPTDPILPLIRQDVPDYITIERTARNNNPWSRVNRWFHYDVLTESERSSAIQAVRPIIEFDRDLELYNYGRIFRGFVDIVVNDMADPVTSFVNSLNPVKSVPYIATDVQIANSGSGYTNGGGAGKFIVQVVGGNGTAAQIEVTLSSGKVIAAQIVNQGSYTEIPVQPVSVTGLTGGTGAEFNLEFSEQNTKFTIRSFNWTNTVNGVSEVFYNGAQIVDGTRILVVSSTNNSQNNRIYRVDGIFSHGIINLLLETDGIELDGSPSNGEVIYVKQGYLASREVYYNGSSWVVAQAKEKIPQAPLFQLYDANPVNNIGVSLQDGGRYPVSNFRGNVIFSYATGNGRIDPVLQQRLSFDSNGEINFQWNLATDRYSNGTQPIDGYYFYKLQGLNHATDRYSNGWYLKESSFVQRYVNQLVILSADQNIVLPWVVSEPVEIRLNGRTLSPTQYTISKQPKSTVIIFVPGLVAEKDVIQIYSEYNENAVGGNFEIPVNLSANANNQEPSIAAKTQFASQFNEIIERNLALVTNTANPGTFFSRNSYRDSPKNLSLGDEILQHNATLLKTMLLFGRDQNNFFTANRYVQREYNKFKNRYIQRMNQFFAKGTFGESSAPGVWFEEIMKSLNLSKTREFAFWSSTAGGAGQFIPPTGAYLGILPNYVPEIFLDTTLLNPVEYIRGHDGSLLPTFGDFRDQIVLELETQIYNSINSKFKNNYLPQLSWYDVVPGKWRSTNYSKTECDKILQPSFELWSVQQSAIYRNNTSYVPENAWSWNYTGITSLLGDELQGSWRNIYYFYFDTDAPHIAPWQMLGFASKPSWWEMEYGPAPYGSLNTKLWQDLRDGRIRQGVRAGIDKRFVRPQLLSILPVDQAGQLLDPIQSGIVPKYVNPEFLNTDWKFGDIGPVELAWRRSDQFGYAMMAFLALAMPASFVDLNWDTVNQNSIYNNLQSTTQYINSLYGRRPSNSVLSVHSENDNNLLGVQTIISHYLQSLNTSVTNQFGNYVRGMTARLGHKMGAYIDANTLSVDSESFGQVPLEDQQIQLYSSQSIKEASYSGIILRYLGGNRYQVFGYDQINPNFNTILPAVGGRKTTIRVGTLANSIPAWAPSTAYIIGDSVIFEGNVYQAVRAHQSKNQFDPSVWKKQNNPAPQPAITAIKYLDPAPGNPVSVVPYGTVLIGYQNVVNFIYNYQRWLISEGWRFTQVNTDPITGEVRLQDWDLNVEEFLNWTLNSLPANSILAMSPFATQVNYQAAFGQVQPIEQIVNGVYSILNREGFLINPKVTNVTRFENQLTIEVNEPSIENAIFAVRLHLKTFENAVFFNNVTQFNDVIYDPLYNQQQDRLTFSGSKALGWNGRLDAPGYYLTENEIRPNFEKTANDFRRYFDLNNQVETRELADFANHTIGYEKRSYLNTLIISDQSQVNFYQGMIHEKGTANSLTKLLRSNFIFDLSNFDFYEEWGFRIGSYGNNEKNQILELDLPAQIKRADPQLIQFNIVEPAEWQTQIEAFTTFSDPAQYRAELQALTLDSPNDDVINVFDFISKKYRIAYDTSTLPAKLPVIVSAGSNFEPNQTYTVYLNVGTPDVTAKFVIQTNSIGEVSQVAVSDQGEYRAVPLVGFYDITENALQGTNWPGTGTGLRLRVQFESQPNSDYVAVTSKLWQVRPNSLLPFFLIDPLSANASRANTSTNKFPNAGFVLANETTYADFTVQDILKPIDFTAPKLEVALESESQIFQPNETLWIYQSPGANATFNNEYLGDWTVARIVDNDKNIRAVLVSDPNFQCPLVVNEFVTGFTSYQGDGIQTNFNIGFDFSSNNEIVVAVDGNIVDTTQYTIVGTQIQFNAAPANAARIEISTKGQWIYLTESELQGWSQILRSGEFYFSGYVNLNGTLPSNTTPQNYIQITTGVESFEMSNLGENYVPGDILTLDGGTVVAGGSPATFRVNNVSLTYVDSISILSSGSGYTDGTYNAIPLIGGSGTPATVDVTVVGGFVVSVTLNTPGSYNIDPPGNIVTADLSPGAGVQFAVNMLPYVSADTVVLANAGTGYQIEDVIEIDPGAMITIEPLRLVVTEVNNVGAVVNFNIVARGQWIPSPVPLPQPLASSILVPGTSAGSGATFNVTFATVSHAIRDIDILFPGDYADLPDNTVYSLLGGNGTNAATTTVASQQGSVLGFADPVEPGDWLAFISREWQRIVPGRTRFVVISASNLKTIYYDPTILSDLVPLKFYHLREVKFNTHTDMVLNYVSPVEGSRAFVMDASDYFSINGNKIWAVFEYQNNAWTLVRRQNSRISSENYDNGLVYDRESNSILTYMQHIDPYNGKISQTALRELNFISNIDPANYNTPDFESKVNAGTQLNIWGKQQVGQTWWDLSTVRFYDYEQEDNNYRRSYWGRTTPKSSVDVYEWVRTTLTPTQYADLENNPEPKGRGTPLNVEKFNVGVEYNIQTGRLQTFYYFWVKNKDTVPNVDFRKISVRAIANQIENPTGAGIVWYAPISENAAIFSGIYPFLKENTTLQINWNLKNKDSNWHSQWVLHRENDPNSVIENSLWNKLRDSLVGFDQYGETQNLFDELQFVTNTVEINTVGTGYNNGTFVAQVIGGTTQSPAMLEVTVAGNTVINVSILNPGIYSQTPALPFAVTGLVGGTGATFNATFRLANNNKDVWIPRSVPDPTLSEVQKYGNLIRPRQTWFRNQCKARQEFVQITNHLLNQLLLDVDRPGWNININQSTPLPFTTATALPNQRVVTDVNDFYNQVVNGLIVPGMQVLVLGNEETANFWSLWLYTSQGPRLINYQRYNTADFYQFVDWYADGIDPSTPPIVSYPNRQTRDLDTLEFAPGRIVIVNNDGNGKWEWTQLQKNESGNLFWATVAKQDGTINLKPEFFENCGNVFGLTFDPELGNSIFGINWDLFDWDLIGWDQLPVASFGNLLQLGNAVSTRDGSLELYYLIEHLRSRVLTNLEDNQLFFKMVNYVFSEQAYVDWAFKTSFISITGYSQALTQSALVSPDLTQALLEYVDEIKPYHVKVRNFVRSLSAFENAPFYVTDFDKPVFFDVETGSYRVLSPTDLDDIVIFEATNNPGTLFNVDFLDLFLNFPRQSQTFTANGGNTIFAMNENIINVSLLEVRVNSLLQTFNFDYYVEGSSVIFLLPPAAGSLVEIVERQLPAIGQALITSKNLWNDWFANYQTNPDLIRRNRIQILLDRVSCLNSEDLANWDENGWSTNNWDSQNNLVNLNAPVVLEIATIQNQTVYNLQTLVQAFPTLWNPINISRVNYFDGTVYRDLFASEYAISYLEQMYFVGDGVTTAFTLTMQQTASNNTIQVKKNGILQTFDLDYTLSGNTVTFVIAPAVSDNIEISILPKLVVDFPTNDRGVIKVYRFLESLERILRYYLPTTGQVSKTALDLIPRCGFSGTVVDGGPFNKTLDWDYFLWDAINSWDTPTIFIDFYNDILLHGGIAPDLFVFEGDGVSTVFALTNPVAVPAFDNLIVYVNNMLQTPITDYTVAGNNVTFAIAPALGDEIKISVAPFAPSPLNAWDIRVDGYDFLRPQYGPNQPEERAQVRTQSPLQISVYTSWSNGELPIETIRAVGDGVRTQFAFEQAPQSEQSVMVFVDGLLIVTGWSLDLLNRQLQFAAPPSSGQSIEILLFGWGGSGRQIGTWAGTGTVVSRSFVSRRYTAMIESRATADGVRIPVSTIITGTLPNQTTWNTALSTPATGLVKIDSFDVTNGTISDMRRQQETAIGGNQTFNLVQNISTLVADQTQLFVFRNGQRLGGADTNYFTGTGTQTLFTLTFDPIVNSNVKVYVNGVLQTQGVDYTVGPNPPPPAPTENFIIEFFTPSAPALGSEVLVVLEENYWFRVSAPNQIIFDDPNNQLQAGDEIVIYSISNAATSSIRTETQKGNAPAVYQISQAPSTPNHIIVSVNGKQKTLASDYIVTSVAYGWDIMNWDLNYTWDTDQENVVVFKDAHIDTITLIGDGVTTQFSTAGLTQIPITSLSDAVDVFVNGVRQERIVDFDLIFNGTFEISFVMAPSLGAEIQIRSFARVVITTWSDLPAAQPVAWLQYTTSTGAEPNWTYWKLSEEQKLNLRTSVFSNSADIQANQNSQIPLEWQSTFAVQTPDGVDPITGETKYNPSKILIGGEIVSFETSVYNPVNRYYVFGNLVRSVDHSPFGTPYATATAVYNGNGSLVTFNVPSPVYNRVIVEIVKFEWNAQVFDYVFAGTTVLVEGRDYVLSGTTVILNSPPLASPTPNYPGSVIVTAVQFDWTSTNINHFGGATVWSLPESAKLPTEFTQNWAKNQGIQYNQNNVSDFLKTGNTSI